MKKYLIILILILTSCTSQFSKDVLSGVLGEMTPAEYTVAFIFAGIGLFIRWFILTIKGIKRNDNNTPGKFSLSYWVNDNWIHKGLSVLFTICIVFLTLRFPKELMELFKVDWLTEFTVNFYALVVGLMLDKIADKYIKKMTNN